MVKGEKGNLGECYNQPWTGKTYTYKMSGTIRIDSPFDYETDPAAMIKIVLNQDVRQRLF